MGLGGAGTGLANKNVNGPSDGYGTRTFAVVGPAAAGLAELYADITLPVGNFRGSVDVARKSGGTSMTAKVYLTKSGQTDKVIYWIAGPSATAFGTTTVDFNIPSAGAWRLHLENSWGCDATAIANFANVSLKDIPAVPTGAASQTFCAGSTVANLVASGTGILWYSVASGGTALGTGTVLVNGTHYYASSVGTPEVESTTRLNVTATVNARASAPTSASASVNPTCGGGDDALGQRRQCRHWRDASMVHRLVQWYVRRFGQPECQSVGDHDLLRAL